MHARHNRRALGQRQGDRLLLRNERAERHVGGARVPLILVVRVRLRGDREEGDAAHRVESDGKLTLVQTSDSAKGDKAETIRYSAEPGLYVLEVRDTKNREANFQDSYQLTVDEGGE